jgi:hypothetical protein
MIVRWTCPELADLLALLINDASSESYPVPALQFITVSDDSQTAVPSRPEDSDEPEACSDP